MSSILTINAGSSSIKFAIFNAQLEKQYSGLMERLGQAPFITLKDTQKTLVSENIPQLENKSDHESGFAYLLDWLTDNNITLSAVGHRVVHGGTQFKAPVLVDDAVLTQLESLVKLAPLHQPHNIAGIRAVMAYDPSIRQVACFDTAFHATMPTLHQHFALPEALFKQGIRRYGFHGLSYEYIATQLDQHLPEKVASGRVVVAHLGYGASLCALKNKQSFNTSMGFTALEGLPMGTRCGTIDPGVLLHFMHEGQSAEAIERLLYHESGFKGMSGLSGDSRDLLASDDPLCKQALDYFAYQTARQIGAMAIDLGGIDALVFTAGIGENSAPIKKMITSRLEMLNIPHIVTIATNEEWMIAQHCRNNA